LKHFLLQKQAQVPSKLHAEYSHDALEDDYRWFARSRQDRHAAQTFDLDEFVRNGDS